MSLYSKIENWLNYIGAKITWGKEENNVRVELRGKGYTIAESENGILIQSEDEEENFAVRELTYSELNRINHIMMMKVSFVEEDKNKNYSMISASDLQMRLYIALRGEHVVIPRLILPNSAGLAVERQMFRVY